MGPRGRALAAVLVLLSAASSGRAQTTGTWDPKLGAGATGLIYGAIKFMEKEGHPDACLSGIEARVNQFVPAIKGDPTTRDGAVNSFHFFFWSPGKPPKTVVTINEPIEGGPLPQQMRYNEYDPYYVGSGDGGIYDVRPTCISELRVDTAKALEVAAKNGLPLGTASAYELLLIHAAGPDEPDWSDRSLRKRVFWAVRAYDSAAKTAREYLVDALTGKFIKARASRIKR
jgi:hypothetical protein